MAMKASSRGFRRSFWLFGILIVVPAAVRYLQMNSRLNNHSDQLLLLEDESFDVPNSRRNAHPPQDAKKRFDVPNSRRNAHPPRDARFLVKHQQIKNDFVDKQVVRTMRKTTTAVSHEQATAIATTTAKQLFVDLDLDPNPKNSNADDPWFVLHIGPPKTATTSIQCGLERHALRLAKTDGYHYLGGGCGKPMTAYYMPNGEAIISRLYVISQLNVKRKQGKHVAELIARSRYLRQKGRSVILSSELFQSKLSSTPMTMNKLSRTLMSQATGAGFSPEKVRIVLAYRHFVDWLPSYYFQKHSMKWRKGGETIGILQYIDNYLSKWEDHERFLANNEERIKAENKLHQGIEPEQEQDQDPEQEPSKEDDDEEDDDNEDIDIVTAVEEEGTLLGGLLPRDRFSIHPAWWAYQLWSSYFPLPNQVLVYDLHSSMNSNRPNDDTVTNFVCNMLPDASRTCSKLMQLEDERQIEEQPQLHSNGTVATKRKQLSGGGGNATETEPDYDNIHLHSSRSWLYPSRNSKVMGGGTNARASADLFNLHAVRIVQELLTTGDINGFDFSGYGPSFFQTARSFIEIQPTVHKGYTRDGLNRRMQQLLDEYNVTAPDERYFDCMSKDLEDRLLKASLTFLNLIYRKTEMLSLAATVSISSGETHSIEDDKEKRFSQALADHARLFEKNKAAGKFCEINPLKLFKALPKLKEIMTALTHKPVFRKHKALPEYVMPHVYTLGLQKKKDWDKIANRPPEYLWKIMSSPDEKAAAFYLGFLNKNTKT